MTTNDQQMHSCVCVCVSTSDEHAVLKNVENSIMMSSLHHRHRNDTHNGVEFLNAIKACTPLSHTHIVVVTASTS